MNMRGSMVVTRFPIRAPPIPPPKQPRVKARTRVLKVSTPIVRAAISSSRTALRMFPKLLRIMQTVQNRTAARHP